MANSSSGYTPWVTPYKSPVDNQSFTPDPNVINAINTAAMANGVSPQIALAISTHESALNQFQDDGTTTLIGVAGDVGAMQLNPVTINTVRQTNPDFDPTNLTQNVNAGVSLIANLQKQFGNNEVDVLGAYAMGAQGWKDYKAGLIPPTPGAVDLIKKVAGTTIPGTPSPAANANSDTAGTPGISVLGLPAPTVAQSVVFTQPTVDYQSLFPDVIINTDLSGTPWYSDTNLITGNPKVRNSTTPVIFEVVLKGRDLETLSTQGAVGTPIQVQLNASMKTFNVAMKHVFTPKRTRTGWHITMWGMEADTIEGGCTTGVFMNQLGLTDFFSTSTIDNQLIELVTSGFQTIYGLGLTQTSEITQQNVNVFYQRLQSITGNDTSEAFRVAAQDAFTEFLFLFKNNGIVWLNSQTAIWYEQSPPSG